MGPIWGIDLGGTKIEGIILEDRETMRVLKRMRIPTDAHRGYINIVRQIYKLIETLTAEIGIRPGKIGIGTPGTLDSINQTMKNCNTTALNGMPLKRDIENMMGIPIEIANDANCFAVAEANLGAVVDILPDAQVVFGAILGTGVGGGVVVNGKVLNGRMGIAGEWGHNFLDESGGACYCGKSGCVERVISGTALEKYYNDKVGSDLKLSEIVKQHEAGNDAVATETVNRLIKFFGKSMANVINILDPDAIVLGGGVGNIDLLYSEGVREVEKYVFNDRLDTLFLKPKLGDSAGVFGAALLT